MTLGATKLQYWTIVQKSSGRDAQSPIWSWDLVKWSHALDQYFFSASGRRHPAAASLAWRWCWTAPTRKQRTCCLEGGSRGWSCRTRTRDIVRTLRSRGATVGPRLRRSTDKWEHLPNFCIVKVVPEQCGLRDRHWLSLLAASGDGLFSIPHVALPGRDRHGRPKAIWKSHCELHALSVMGNDIVIRRRTTLHPNRDVYVTKQLAPAFSQKTASQSGPPRKPRTLVTHGLRGALCRSGVFIVSMSRSAAERATMNTSAYWTPCQWRSRKAQGRSAARSSPWPVSKR
jgi:hypothetical protein